MSVGPHPSPYALDRAAATGRLSELGEHATSCPECAQHLRRIQERRAIPERLASLSAGAPRWSAPRWVWAGGAAAVASALVVLVVTTARPPAPTYVGAKGGPSALIYVKRGDLVFPWAPPERVRPGDLLRLAVVPDGFSQLTVATPGAGGWTVLFQGEVSPERAFELPTSWRVDAVGSAEKLLVVLGRQPVRQEDLQGLAAERPRTEEVWTAVLEIEKIGGR